MKKFSDLCFPRRLFLILGNLAYILGTIQILPLHSPSQTGLTHEVGFDLWNQNERCHEKRCFQDIQSTLVISTSLISNNRLFRTENLVPVFTRKSNNRLTKYRSNFSSFPQYFQYSSNFWLQITYSFVKCGCSSYFFLKSANLIYHGTDILEYFGETLGVGVLLQISVPPA